MNRRFGAVAIVLMALAALAAVLSFVFFSQPLANFSIKTKDSNVAGSKPQSDTSTDSSQPSTENTSRNQEKINPSPTEPPAITSVPLIPVPSRPDQPLALKPSPPAQSPDWKLLDWSLKPLPEKPGVQLRAASYLASGKYPFVRVEEEIQVHSSGEIKILRTAEMVGDQIIVKLPENSSPEEIQSLASKLGGQAAAKPFAPNTWLIALPRTLEAVPEALAGSTQHKVSISYAEPSFLVRSLRTPNDPRFNDYSLWHLYNNDRPNADIGAAKAWDRRFSGIYGTPATNRVIVAVIDSGVRLTHQDISANLWVNTQEQAGKSKVDDDGNGYIDDINGWDFYSNDANPSPGSSSNYADGHGTHCSGIIAANGNNGIGTVGVAWSGVQIMPLRFLNNGSGSIPNAIRAMNYAKNNGARVINASYGTTSYSQAEADAISGLEQAGVIIVAASGNDGSNNDLTPFYPASHTNNCLVSVGGTSAAQAPADGKDVLWSSSNYGQTSVDLMAPADVIYSTRHSSDTDYGTGSGTSYAAPIVSAAVALRIAEFPNETLSQTVSFFRSTNAVDLLPSLTGKCVTGGRLNLSKVIGQPDPNMLPLADINHRPSFFDSRINSTMRSPSNAVYSNTVTFQSALKKFNNTNGVNTYGIVFPLDGVLFYRFATNGPWSFNNLALSVTNGDYQFIFGKISNVPVGLMQYYLQFNFDSGARTTYAFYSTNADGYATTTNQATAQASPYFLTVSKATATLTISGTNQTYNGLPRSVSVTTTPASLATQVTYNGNPSAPIEPGTYAVLASVNDANYQGSSTANFFLAGIDNPTGDSNGNGVPNLLEYALLSSGTSTTNNNPGGFVTQQSLNDPTNSNSTISLVALVRTNDSRLSYLPQASLDLGGSNWVTTGFTTNIPSQTNVPTGFQRREYQFNAGTNPRAFLKLTIEQK